VIVGNAVATPRAIALAIGVRRMALRNALVPCLAGR
jgi:hypothetical protein